jgi:hypothetical protein
MHCHEESSLLDPKKYAAALQDFLSKLPHQQQAESVQTK